VGPYPQAQLYWAGRTMGWMADWTSMVPIVLYLPTARPVYAHWLKDIFGANQRPTYGFTNSSIKNYSVQLSA
jgi:hypothetical protein